MASQRLVSASQRCISRLLSSSRWVGTHHGSAMHAHIPTQRSPWHLSAGVSLGLSLQRPLAASPAAPSGEWHRLHVVASMGSMLSSPVHGICMLAMMCCCLLVEACRCFPLCSRVGAFGRVPQSPRNLQSVRLMAASPHADLEAAMVRRQHPRMTGQQAATLGGASLSVLCCAPARGVLQVAGL